MKWAAPLLLGLVSASITYAADWIEIGTANFQLLTNAPESVARKTLTSFEQARDFFLREQPSFSSPPRATIIGFTNYAEYKPYSSKAGDLAYYISVPQGDYIVISDLGMERMRVAIHEYVHLLVAHSRLSIPLWLNEGMAEVYSTLEERDGKLVLGEMKRDRVNTLNDGNWMRLPMLLRVDEQSAAYNEEDLEGMFYAESCLLTHMLMLGDGYADKFTQFLERISATGSTQTAFADVYGKPTSDIEKDMKLYYFQKVRGGAAYRGAPAKVEIGEARHLSSADIGITLANLQLNLGRDGEARVRLKALAAANPGNADIESELGYIDEVRDERESALEHYRRAVAMHSGGWPVYWNYARLLDDAGGELTPRLQALDDAVQRKPDLTEARLRLAMHLCEAGRFSDALARLQQAPKVEAEHAVAMYAALALASFGMKQTDDAHRYAEQARAAAHTPEEKAVVEQLYAQIQPGSPSTPATQVGAPGDPDRNRPTLRRQPPPAPPKKGGGGLPLVK